MKKYLIYIIQALIIVLFLLAWFFGGSGRCGNESILKKKIFNGKVERKYYDERSHQSQTLELKYYNKKIPISAAEKSGFYDFVEIGDSLIKERGSLDIRLIRNNLDTIFTIDYGCEK